MDIPGILHRFAENTVTEAERAEFAAYLKGLSVEEYEALMQQYEVIEQGTGPGWVRDYVVGSDGVGDQVAGQGGGGDRVAVPGEVGEAHQGVSAPGLFARILEEIDVLEGLEWQPEEGLSSRRIPPQRGIPRWTAWAAAACLLLIAGIYLLRRPSPSGVIPSAPTAVATTIGPGGNKAVLILANGSSIILDSVANGRLTGQGGRNVVKIADGKLLYDAGINNNSPDAGMLYNTLTTPRGGQYQVTLSDGTKVWLNAASTIKYPTTFAGKDREVQIRGEVYFEVARNDIHPFKVNILPVGNSLLADSNRISIEVLGTHFNINAYQDEADKQVHTTLLEGAVRVALGGKAQIIRPGQQANISFDDRHFNIRNDADLESVMAWKNGKLVFNKGDIRELMLEISRWYDVDVKYQGDVPSGGFYGLIDRNVPLTSVLHVLGAYGIKTKMENKTIIVQ